MHCAIEALDLGGNARLAAEETRKLAAYLGDASDDGSASTSTASALLTTRWATTWWIAYFARQPSACDAVSTTNSYSLTWAPTNS